MRIPFDGNGTCIVGHAGALVVASDDLLSRHLRIVWRGAELFLEQIDNAPVAVNGTPVTGAVRITAGDWLTIGKTVFQLAIDQIGGDQRPCATAAGERRAAPVPTAAPDLVPDVPRVSSTPEALTIGRLPECGLRIPSPVISRRHARIVREGQVWSLEDLGSTNGTFLNGRRLDGPAVLAKGDRVQFGSFAFTFAGGRLHEVPGAGSISVEARALRKRVVDAATRRPKDLLAEVSLAIHPGEFVGIFGTSGSGKSTLLDALNGRRPASEGSVLYNGTDLYRSFDLFRSTIGYVPQQDIVHRKITVGNALRYTARLRLPPDTSDTEIAEYVRGVLDRVGLADKADQPIDTPAPLSGGQLKRVNLAIELIANPAILFLDEATSGLDAGTEKRMMRLFAELAADGKTVACVTHTLESVDVCHLVAVLFAGRVVYFGPPGELTAHFGIRRLSDVYETLDTAPPERWVERYEASGLHHEFVARRLGPGQENGEAAAVVSITPRQRRRGLLNWEQTRTLTRRYVDLILSDRRNLAVLLAQAPIIGAVIGLVFDTSGSLAARAAAESQVSFMLVISSVWFGCLNSAREVVKELPIYQRERSVNLEVLPYVISKLAPLSALCLAQCVALLLVVSFLLDLPGDMVGRVAPLFLSGFAASVMGLTVSTLVNTADKAIAIVPILLIPQVVLSGAIVDLSGITESIAKATVIAFWGFDCLKNTLEPQVREMLTIKSSYGRDLVALGAFVVAFFLSTVAGLKLSDRRR